MKIFDYGMISRLLSMMGCLLFLIMMTPSLNANSFQYTRSETYGLDFNTLQGLSDISISGLDVYQDSQDLKLYSSQYHLLKDLQFSSKYTLKIPKTFHFIWIGPAPFPTSSVQYVRSWISRHPDWTFIFWTDRNRPAPCNGMEVKQLKDFEFLSLKDHLDQSQNWAEKSDLWRYEILYQMGGVYIDHDMECLTPFDSLNHAYDFYAGLEATDVQLDDMGLLVGNGLIGTRKYHPILKKTIEKILESDRAQNNLSPIFAVLNYSYKPFTFAVRDNLVDEELSNIVLPASYFFPTKGLTGIYAVHHYASLWHPKNNQEHYEKPCQKALNQRFKKFEKKQKKMLYSECLILLTVLGSLIGAYLNRQKAS